MRMFVALPLVAALGLAGAAPARAAAPSASASALASTSALAGPGSPGYDPAAVASVRSDALLGRAAIARARTAALPGRAAAEPAPPTQLVLPAPTGRGRIGTVSLHLIDRSRPDPWVAAEPAREIMVQIWYPAGNVKGYPRAPWVSPGVADLINPPGSPLILPVTHGHVGAPASGGRHPVVLFSSGLGLDRSGSTALVEELAGRGYVVVTIDHTHDAQFVEFPDGRIAPFAIPEPTSEAEGEATLAKVLAVRVADTRFTLDRLTALTRGHNPDAGRRPLPRGLSQALDLSRIGMFGTSIGGATAAETMHEDSRVQAGLNLDGSHFGAVVTAGLDRPFLLIGSDAHGDESDETWDTLWAHLRGPRLQLELLGPGHLSFTDLQVLLPQAGTTPEDMEPAFGTINGARAVRGAARVPAGLGRRPAPGLRPRPARRAVPTLSRDALRPVKTLIRGRRPWRTDA